MGTITEGLKKYFETHTKEEVLRDWEATKKCDEINSPTIEEFMKPFKPVCSHIMTRNPKEHQENKCRLCGLPYKKDESK